MPSKINLHLLCAAMLAALLLCASAAPVEDAATDSPAGDTSGEEAEKTSDLLSASPIWDRLLPATAQHQKAFEDEFHQNVSFLKHYTSSSFPAKCPNSNFSKEACLQRLAQGLLIYSVLLKHVEKEYPSNPILPDVRLYSGPLISLIKEKMKNSKGVTPLTSSQEEQLLTEFNNPNTFQRKMMAHSILHHLHFFLVDAKRSVHKREKPRGTGMWNTLV